MGTSDFADFNGIDLLILESAADFGGSIFFLKMGLLEDEGPA